MAMVAEEQAIKKELTKLLKAKNVSDEPAILEDYSRDQSFVRPRKPNFVVWPTNVEEVQGIVNIANQYKMPIIPYSSGKDFAGATIPNQGGILVDLSRMNQISEIDTFNWMATFAPGVTFKQLNAELAKHGLRASAPLATPPSASVLSTYLERVPTTAAADFSRGNELIVDYDIVMPTGEVFTIGNPALPGSPHAAPYGPQINFCRLWAGAQGTLGIITRMTVRIMALPTKRRIIFMPFNSIDQMMTAVGQIQRRDIGLECLALNSFNLAAMIASEDRTDAKALAAGDYVGRDGARKWPNKQRAEFEALRQTLPPWTLVVCLTAPKRFPDEKIAYQETALREIAAGCGTTPSHTVSGVVGLEEIFKQELLLPQRGVKKYGYQGTCHSLMFHTELSRVGEYEALVHQVAVEFDYPTKDIGGYILPVERGRGIYCVFDFHCDPSDPEAVAQTQQLFAVASEALIDSGAFFDRPYGIWAEMMYRRTGGYTVYLKRLKEKLDPNNIMNPGKLCFGGVA